MTKLSRQALLIAILLLNGNILQAQSVSGIPKEADLNRYGLTLSWLGQAVNDPRRDTILQINADEMNVYVQSSSGILTTFHAETGEKIWSALIGMPEQRSFPVKTNDRELLVASGMTVYSFNKMTGELLWELLLTEFPAAAPSVSESHVFIGTIDGSVFAYDLRRVQELHEKRMLPRWSFMARDWRFKTSHRIVSSPIHSDSTVLFANQRGIVYSLSDVNKELKFQFETHASINTPLNSIGNNVLIADSNSRLFCLNKTTGRTQWTYSSGAVMDQQPLAVGNQVYIIPTRKGLSALSLASGRSMWTSPEVTQFLSVSDQRVYTADFGENLMILDRNDGKTIGKVPMRSFVNRVCNERTDRIFVANSGGLVLAIREEQLEFPIFHAFPDQRPIMPELAVEDDGASSAEENSSN